MELEFIEKRDRGTDPYVWQPFEDHSGFTDHWWERPMLVEEGSTNIEIRSDGVEVARVEMGEGVNIDHYVGVPLLGAHTLEIRFLEVSTGYRRRGNWCSRRSHSDGCLP